VTKQFFVPLVAGLVAACSALIDVNGQSLSHARLAAHGYYLFLDRPREGCEPCYVPLLVTVTRLEDLSKQKKDEAAILITTYERDSIVGAPREVKLLAADISPQERKLRVQARFYRYHEVPASEVLSLLEHPNGTIPISRTLSMGVPSAEELVELINRFRAATQ
jgi:hypothetical protein